MNPENLRLEALTAAIKTTGGGETTEQILARAKAYASFLSGTTPTA